MALSDITRDGVLAAIGEYDQSGPETFLEVYGYRPARAYVLVYRGRRYDSEAIVGVAHKHARGQPLQAADFSGGEQTVGRLLRRLGFEVRAGRDPTWAWDELVLACALVADNGWKGLDSNERRVIELSQLLQHLPIHDPGGRSEKFRNANGVARKTSDIATAHPDYRGRPTRGGQLDREVLAAFLERPDEMHAAAASLRAGVLSGEFAGLPDVDPAELDEISAPEGRLLVRQHLTRERSRTLRERKIYVARATSDALACEVCDFDFERTYGPSGAGYIECHHVVPLHVGGEGQTRLEDLALLCANCHRVIHRRTPWPTPEQLRALIIERRSARRIP